MKPLDFQTTLDHCIERIGSGESVGQCLAEYPEMASDLFPLLVISSDLMNLPELEPSPTSAVSGKEAMFAAFDSVQAEGISTPSRGETPNSSLSQFWGWLFNPQPQLRFATRLIMIVIGILATGFLTANASADSLPGDQLYPVKRLIEETRLAFTFNPADQVILSKSFEDLRREEIKQLKADGRTAEVEFSGQLTQNEVGDWFVADIPVAWSEDLEQLADQFSGSIVLVESEISDNGEIIVNAVLSDEESDLPIPSSTPQASESPTATATATSTSTLKPTETAGSDPEIVTTVQPTSTSTAQFSGEEATKQPAKTREARPTQTATLPVFNETATPVKTREVTRTPRPTETGRPTNEATRRATRTPRPTMTETEVPTSRPTRTVRPTQTEAPTSTARPTQTPRPTRTPTAIPTDTPTRTQKPTSTLRPTSTSTSAPTALPANTATPRPNDLTPVITKPVETVVRPTTTVATSEPEPTNTTEVRPTSTPFRDEATATRERGTSDQATATQAADDSASPTPANEEDG